MKVVVAEKPSVARDIAKVIGANTNKDGYIEGNGYQVTWCVGHLVSLLMPEHYDEKYKKWTLDQLPIIPTDMKTGINAKTKSQYTVIKKLMTAKDTTEVICATDAGREGEYIFGLVYRQAKCTKPVKRLWISSMTSEAISKGFRELKDGGSYERLYKSAECRSIADWLVGLNATRYYSCSYQTMLTIGRVQTPTLALIVDRYNEIQNFKPQKFYELEAIYDGFKGTWYNEDGTRIASEEQAISLRNDLLGHNGTIEKVDKQKKSKGSPLLFDLTELQRRGNEVYGYTAQQTLSLAQALYETHKATTYPRTDSRYLSEDMKSVIPGTLKSVGVGENESYVCDILSNEIKYNKRVFNNEKVSDHHAIIPTNKAVDLNKLSEDELNIYNLIVTRFIAAFSKAYEYEETKVDVVVNDQHFKSSGKIVITRGWKELEDRFKVNEKVDTELPPLTEGGTIVVQDICKMDKLTTAKKHHTESTLLSAMENAGREIEEEDLKEQLKGSGIGTPATRSGVIERLINTKYIIRKGKSIHPTDKALKLIQVVPDTIKSAKLTGEWELKLNNIANADGSAQVFMDEIKVFVKNICSEEISKTVTFESEKKEKEVIGVCPRCGKNIYENKKAFGCEGYKEGCTFSLWKEDKFFKNRGKKITKTIAKSLLKQKYAKVKGFKKKDASGTYDATVQMKDTGKYINFDLSFK